MWVVISDTHIGDKHADEFLPKLFDILREYSYHGFSLILNGDIFDFSKNLIIDDRHREFISIIKNFKEVVYIEGNHDWFISGFDNTIPNFSFKKSFDLKVNNKLIKIIHGHQADNFVVKIPKLNRFLVRINNWIYEKIGIDVQHFFRNTKFVGKMLKKQESKLIEMMKSADVILAGHTHRLGSREESGVLYYNTGDWVEKDHGAIAIVDNNGNISLNKI